MRVSRAHLMLHFRKVLKNISSGLLSCATRLKCFYLAVMDYLATFSRRFIMMNMKSAETTHTPMNTLHTTHSGSPPHR